MPPPLIPPGAPSRAGWAIKGLWVLAVIAVMKAAQPLLAPVMVAVVITFVLATPVRWLKRRLRLPEVVGAAVMVGALVLVTALGVAGMAGPAAQWWERAPTTLNQLTEQFDRIRSAIPMLAPPPPASAPPAPVRASRNAPPPTPAPPPADPVKEKIASESLALTGAFLRNSLTFAISTAATVILLYFLLASEHWMLSRSVEAIPRRRTRALVVGGVRAAQREISRFLATLGLINVGVAVATALAMNALDLPNPVLWGTVCGILNFIPYIGPMMASALLLVAGILSFGDAASMAAPALAFLAIHAIESNFVSPFIVGRQLALSPVSVFLSVMFWGWLWGIVGALIAVPVLVGVRAVCKRNRRWRLVCVYLEGGGRDVPSLRALLRVRRRRVLPLP